MAKHVEMINEYLIEDDSDDFEFFDNHGLLIRCKDCKHKQKNTFGCWCVMFGRTISNDFYCGYGKKDDSGNEGEREKKHE